MGMPPRIIAPPIGATRRLVAERGSRERARPNDAALKPGSGLANWWPPRCSLLAERCARTCTPQHASSRKSQAL